MPVTRVRLTAVLLGTLIPTCERVMTDNSPPRIPQPTNGYRFSTQALVPHAVPGEEWHCYLSAESPLVGQPLDRRWEGDVPFRVLRQRKTATSTTAYDTLLPPQHVIMERGQGQAIRIILGGLIADTLTGVEDTYYIGEMIGDWTCDPGLPMASFHDGRALNGGWRVTPQ
jgi:hypothetical protein